MKGLLFGAAILLALGCGAPEISRANGSHSGGPLLLELDSMRERAEQAEAKVATLEPGSAPVSVA